MNQGWANVDGNGHHWPGQPGMPPAFYGMPADPLVSPDYAGWWQRGIALAKQVWKPSLILHAIVIVPTLALTVPANTMFTAESATVQEALRNGGGLPPMNGYLRAMALLMAAFLVSGLLSTIATAVTVRLVVAAATGQPVSLPTALREGVRRVPALIGWGILAGLLALGAVLACILPIVYVAAAVMVLPVVVTLERGSGIGRCFSLFHADLGTSVARIATLFGIGTVAALALGLVGIVLEAGISGTAGVVGSTVANGMYALAAGLVLPPLLVTAYADMRSRREPFSTAYLAPRPV
ncbi:hypothetical protein QLQ12_42610 [Actinoplanes sp. NEAU-A12]|uniref:Glycerophosphoryl diester phosphodiesterase membrane domain-containing protein n=1 Tax=Actinoplanes sandaracinus TaxID=3045177 RepID=A0ABT6WZV9_9ACTN|nr:hypothetical protein [Actinoplanes sandaracinus]MDI6105295.1 hypothetical protein [Actinoplanes sandaracinus]